MFSQPEPHVPDNLNLNVLAIEYAPHIMAAGNENGFAFQQLRERLQGSNIKVQPEILPLTRLELVLGTQYWCASFIPFPNVEEHSESFLFNDIPFVLNLVRLKQDQAFKWNSLQELAGLRLGVIRSRDSWFVKHMRENGVKIVYTNTTEQSYRMLLRDRVDFVLSDQVSGNYYQTKFGYKHNQFQLSENSVAEIDNAITFNLNCKEAREALSYLKNTSKYLSKN